MKSKIVKRAAALGLTVAMTASLAVSASAANMTYTVQKSPMTVDQNLITCAAHAQADVSPEVLGISNTTDRETEVPGVFSLSKASTSPLMGVFGTDMNESPNPYLYNWVYNSYASENGLTLADIYTLGGIASNTAPHAVDAEVSEEWGGTCRSLFYRPDILVGTMVTNSAGLDYTALVADLPENKDSDPSNDYDPYIVDYSLTRTYDFLDTLYDLANVCNEITAETGKTTRYGDPLVIANDVTKYAKGLQCYVLAQLEKDNAEQKTVAIVDPINSADGVFYCVNENTSVQRTTTCSRAGEFLADTTENIVDVLGKTYQTGTIAGTEGKTYYILTAEEIAQADVIITSGVQNQDGNEDAFRELLIQYIDPSNTALIAKVETMPMLSTRFSCVGSIGANSIENLLGMAYWTAFCYPEYLNPVYVTTYWYENFYHISDNSSLQTAIAANLDSVSIPDGFGYTTDISGYRAADIESKIIEGLHYYENNSSKVSDLLLTNFGNNGQNKWVVDWTSGIGAVSTDPQNGFADINSGAWYYNAVMDVSAKNLMSDTGNGKFSPNAPLTRGMVATVLYRMSGESSGIAAEASAAFSDVSVNQWYAAAVDWAADNGIVTGYQGKFNPNSNVTRQDMVTMLYRYAQYRNDDTSVFNDLAAFGDKDDTASYAVEAMKWAVGDNLINGRANLLAPKGQMSRAEFATVVSRYLA